ncbi:monocarboxylate transporter 13 isoform X3 [Patella vulgata]|uniref:monocarboxylate transporter 13 isoform X3 n=1 Tax=Patella vulgata TaxID=6465 RepID=UPI00217F5B08|nr:monocarboxylate transporter 13 isoform X3 [Patella vulgata]
MHSSTKNKKNNQVNHAVDLAPDGGWGWVVCFGAFMINFIADGTMFSFGILFLELLDYFKDSKFKTAIVGSSQLGLSMMMGPVVSMLLKKYTCRQVTIVGGLIASVWMGVSIFSPNIELMILTFGVLSGAGICLVYLTSIIVVGLYFTKKRAIATGIATSGAGVGVFVYGYLTDYLLGVYDWKVQSIPITYLPGLAVTHGISRSNAALLISIVGISNTIGRVVAGFTNDVLNVKSIVLYFVAFCIGAVVNFVFPFCVTFPTLIVTTAGFGLCMAVAVSMRSIVIADLMKIERLTQSFGIIALFQGVAFIISPPLAGKLMDVTGTYMSPFFLVANIYFICATVCLVVIVVQRQKNTKHQNVLDKEKENWI